jgi:hypothetical protein
MEMNGSGSEALPCISLMFLAGSLPGKSKMPQGQHPPGPPSRDVAPSGAGRSMPCSGGVAAAAAFFLKEKSDGRRATEPERAGSEADRKPGE